MATWLAQLGADTTGLSLVPQGEASLFQAAQIERDLRHIFVDLTNLDAVQTAVDNCRPDIVLHLAAQALVRQSYRDPVQTIAANVLGTTNLLHALARRGGVRAVLVVTSDKVYANDEIGRSFTEDDRLGGHDPYAASKAASEIIAKSMALSFLEPAGTRVATARGGNVVGGGDFSADRIVPDIWRAARRKEALVLRYPAAIRPWQHVLDCLAGYLAYAESLATDGSIPRALNIGPLPGAHLTVGEIATLMLTELGAKEGWRTETTEQPREMARLSIDPTLSRRVLGIADRWPGRSAFARTAAWYRRFDTGESARAIVSEQIAAYERGEE